MPAIFILLRKIKTGNFFLQIIKACRRKKATKILISYFKSYFSPTGEKQQIVYNISLEKYTVAKVILTSVPLHLTSNRPFGINGGEKKLMVYSPPPAKNIPPKTVLIKLKIDFRDHFIGARITVFSFSAAVLRA